MDSLLKPNQEMILSLVSNEEDKHLHVQLVNISVGLQVKPFYENTNNTT